MPVRKTIPEKDGIYFITFTCAQWLPLFQITNGYDAVYNWFNVLKQTGHYIIGYTIMTNHVIPAKQLTASLVMAKGL